MQRSVASTCKKWAVHFPAPRTPSVARAPRWAVLITSRRRVRFLRPSLNSGSDPDGKALSLKILGISGFEGSIPFKRAHWPNLDEREYRISQGHDSAAALVVDGTVVAAVAEERISRRKHTGAFPRGAIAYCLAEAGLGIEDIDELAHGFDYAPYRSVYGVDPVSRDLYREVYSRNALLALVARDVPGFPAERVHHVGHHLAHAASAYYTSGWDECLVVVIDGMGRSRVRRCTTRTTVRWSGSIKSRRGTRSGSCTRSSRCTSASISMRTSTRSWGSLHMETRSGSDRSSTGP